MAVLVTRLKACVADNWTRGLLLCNSGEQTPSSHSSCHNLLLLLYSFCVMIGYPILVSKPWNGQEVFWATVRIWWQELHSKSATFHCLVRSELPQGMAPYASAQGPHAAVDWSCLREALRAKVHNEEVESSLQMTSAPRKASYAKEAVPTRFFDCCAHRKKKRKAPVDRSRPPASKRAASNWKILPYFKNLCQWRPSRHVAWSVRQINKTMWHLMPQNSKQ